MADDGDTTEVVRKVVVFMVQIAYNRDIPVSVFEERMCRASNGMVGICMAEFRSSLQDEADFSPVI